MMESQGILRACLLVFCLVACFGGNYYGGIAEAADWPHWRGPDYNGISKETDWSATWPEDGPKILWKASIGTGFSSIVVSDGRAYTMGNVDEEDRVYCFDAVTGDEIWKKSYPCPLFPMMHEGGPCSTPTVDGDALYTLSKKGDIIRFNAATGEIIWQKNLADDFGCEYPKWHFAGSPLIVDDLVILNAGTRGIALNKADGSLKWQNGTEAGAYSTAVPFTKDGKKCVAMAVAEEVVGLDIATGKALWQIPWQTRSGINAADTILSGDKVFISSGYNVGCGLFNVGSGEPVEIYKNKNLGNHFNSSVLWKGHVYGFNGQAGRNGPGRGELTCLDFETGRVKWTQGGMGTGSLILADGKLIILSEDGKLVIAEASPDGYKEISSASILTFKCWTSPIFANGRVYARNTEGQLVCVDLSGKS